MASNTMTAFIELGKNDTIELSLTSKTKFKAYFELYNFLNTRGIPEERIEYMLAHTSFVKE